MFMNKTFKLRIEVNYLILMKSIYSKHHVYRLFERLTVFPSKIESKTRMSSVITAVQPSTGSSSHCSKARKKTSRSTDWGRRYKSVPAHR